MIIKICSLCIIYYGVSIVTCVAACKQTNYSWLITRKKLEVPQNLSCLFLQNVWENRLQKFIFCKNFLTLGIDIFEGKILIF